MNTVKQFDFSPVLGWSVSRYDLFSTCKRQYYYSYYTRYDDEYSWAKIDALKRLTSIPLEIGNIVHDVIKVLLERLLKSEQEINRKRFLDYARRKTEDYCRKKAFCEVYYKDIKGINIDEIFSKVQDSLLNFLKSNRYKWIKTQAIMNKTDWLIEPPGYGETRIDGQKAYCKVDFLFPVDDRIFILDWKTGKPNEDKHKKQLLAYSSWASFHYEKEPIEIIPIIAYLQPEYSEMKIAINEFDIEELALQVKNETDEMYAFCKNIEENLPKAKGEFPKTTRSYICNYCNFRELCS